MHVAALFNLRSMSTCNFYLLYIRMLKPEDESAIRSVFTSYDKEKKGWLSIDDFSSLLNRLSKKVDLLRKSPITKDVVASTFALFNRSGDGKMKYIEFRSWWLKNDRYSYLVGARADLVQKAYNLYQRYTSTNNCLSAEQFISMMQDLGIECTIDNFDQLDINSDGALSFEEFSRWLKWF